MQTVLLALSCCVNIIISYRICAVYLDEFLNSSIINKTWIKCRFRMFNISHSYAKIRYNLICCYWHNLIKHYPNIYLNVTDNCNPFRRVYNQFIPEHLASNSCGNTSNSPVQIFSFFSVPVIGFLPCKLKRTTGKHSPSNGVAFVQRHVGSFFAQN